MSEVLNRGSADAFVAWELPEMPRREARGPRTRAELETMREEVRAAAHAQGLAEGLAAARDEAAARVATLDQLLTTLSTPFEALDEEVEQQIVALAVAIARQLIRRELKTDPGEIVAVVREALSVLPVSAREVRLHLHPEDAKLIAEIYAGSEETRRWQIVEDPVISRGGCRVSSDSSQIDATLEKRIGATISRVLGDERAGRHD